MYRINKKKEIDKTIFLREIRKANEYKIKIPSNIKVIVKTVLSLIILSILCYLFYVNKGILTPKIPLDTFNNIFITITAILLLVLMIWLVVNIVLTIISIYYYNETIRNNFVSIFLKKNALLIEIFMSLVSISIFLSLNAKDDNEAIVSLRTSTAVNPDKIEVTLHNILNYFVSAACVLVYILICRLMISYVCFKIHYEHYEEKILKLKKMCDLLLSLEQSFEGASIEEPITLFYMISNNEEEISPSHFREVGWSELSIDFFFNNTDVNIDERISVNEFTEIIINLCKEKVLLEKSISCRNKSLKKLGIIAYIVTFPILVLELASIFGRTGDFKGLVAGIAAVILPLNFIFGGIMADLLRSIILMFFVRPFDIGDKIFYNNEIHKIADIGLLYTTFYKDSKHFNVSNTNLSKEAIINISKSKYSSHSFFYRVSTQVYYQQRKNFFSEIKNYVEGNKKMFFDNFFSYNTNFVDEKTVILEIVVRLYCMHNYANQYNEAKEKFIRFVEKNFEKFCIFEKK